MSDFIAELHRLPSAFDPARQSLLDRLGLPADLMLFITALGMSPIETDGDLFQPVEHGPPALVLPVYRGVPPSFARPSEDEPEAPHDLVAFHPDRPGRWWWRTGSADVLRRDLIEGAITWQTPLSLVATPLDYLRARCDAACLLDPSAAWKHLLGVPAVTVNPGDLAFARRIDRLLRKPPAALPKIMIRKEPVHELR